VLERGHPDPHHGLAPALGFPTATSSSRSLPGEQAGFGAVALGIHRRGRM
jgi:hypothetical protein